MLTSPSTRPQRFPSVLQSVAPLFLIASAALFLQAAAGGEGGGAPGAAARTYGPPSVITYTCLIGLYSGVGDQAGAEALLREAEESGAEMDASIYTTLLTAYARLGRVSEAQRMLERMEARGLQLDLLAYNGLLNAYVKAREFTRADMLLFTEMKRKGVRPNRCEPHERGCVGRAWSWSVVVVHHRHSFQCYLPWASS